MTTMSTTKRDGLLRLALRGNGLFSGLSGLLAIIAGGAVANFIGAGDAALFAFLGASLVLYALLLAYLASRETLDARLTWAAIGADVLWVLASVAILATDAFGLSTGGRWLVLILADVVAVFAVVQYVGLRRMQAVH